MADTTPTIRNNSEKRSGRSAKSLVLAGATLALLAGGGWILASKRFAHRVQASTTHSVEYVLHLEGFLVNLADPSGDCFLRVGIELGLGRPIGGHAEKDAATPSTARIRDVILGVLTTYRSDDLLVPAGKQRLKQQLLHALLSAAPDLDVREVYFTDFLVQR